MDGLFDTDVTCNPAILIYYRSENHDFNDSCESCPTFDDHISVRYKHRPSGHLSDLFIFFNIMMGVWLRTCMNLLFDKIMLMQIINLFQC